MRVNVAQRSGAGVAPQPVQQPHRPAPRPMRAPDISQRRGVGHEQGEQRHRIGAFPFALLPGLKPADRPAGRKAQQRTIRIEPHHGVEARRRALRAGAASHRARSFGSSRCRDWHRSCRECGRRRQPAGAPANPAPPPIASPSKRAASLSRIHASSLAEYVKMSRPGQLPLAASALLTPRSAHRRPSARSRASRWPISLGGIVRRPQQVVGIVDCASGRPASSGTHCRI